MEWVVVGVILFIVLFALMILGVPVGYSMICTAALYLLYRWGLSGAELMVSNAFDAAGNYLLLAAPLFILMGECIAASGLGKGAFRVVDSWLGWVPGSLGVSCIATGTLFGAATGFSATGIAALGPVVLPEVQARGYAPDLGMGALGGGAALAVLIPPSVPFIIYGFLSGASISTLFFAGLIPGIVGMLLFTGYVIVRAVLNPMAARRGPRVGWRDRILSTWRILPLVAIVGAVLGSIWLGIATPTEAASVGAVGSIILMIGYRQFSWSGLKEMLFRTLRSTLMIYVVVMGASVIGQVLSASGFISNLVEWVGNLGVPVWSVLVMLMICNFFLGMFMSNTGMLFLTLPIFIPIVTALHIDLVWFGVLTIIMTEIASLTPPVGMNLFFMKALTPENVSFMDVARSVLPYTALYAVLLLLIAFFPPIALWLPNLMGK